MSILLITGIFVIVEAHYAVYMYVHMRRLLSTSKLLAEIVFLVVYFDKVCAGFFHSKAWST